MSISAPLRPRVGAGACRAASLAWFWGMARTSRYWSTVSWAQWRQLQRSITRCRPAAPMRARRSASSRPRRDAWRPARRRRPAGQLKHGLAVGAGDLGQGAARGGDQADAGGHGLDRGQREALVQAGHDGQLGLGVELDDALVGHARTTT